MATDLVNAPWKLEIITRIDDPKPKLVLNGMSDGKGLIQADLSAYPEIRKAFESGHSLRLSNAVGSSLLDIVEINYGELILSVIGNSFRYAYPKFTCQDTAVLAN